MLMKDRTTEIYCITSSLPHARR